MSGIIAVYGLVVSVLIAGGRECSHMCTVSDYISRDFPRTRPHPLNLPVKPTDYSLYAGFIHLGAGLACGFTGLAAGYAIGYVGDSVRHSDCSTLPFL